MIRSSLVLVFLLVFLVFIDWYVWKGIKVILLKRTKKVYLGWKMAYRAATFAGFAAVLIWHFLPTDTGWRNVRTALMVGVLIPYLCKLLMVVFLMLDDIRRGFQWLFLKVQKSNKGTSTLTGEPRIPRSEFLAKTALVAGGGMLGTFAYGIISGAHDYHIHRIRIPIKNLPKEFHGMRIAQLSDIHTGSFFNKKAVRGGVEMMLREKADLAVFTGDLVNERTDEVRDYIEIFEKVKAPLGVYSVLGNHDYGDYVQWASSGAKAKNLQDMVTVHKQLGWQLLMDEHRAIAVDGANIGLVGIQNWGKGRFPKYGDLAKADRLTAEFPVKILLSHDPSHWDLQVLPEFKDIDLSLAGHTHGMQFGVEIPGFHWSPAQYEYKQWAGLYQQENQYLYVNRGFGFIGYPGRVGIWPEITILELVKG